ncbi:hypothetical protein FB45DRAFT_899281 [Roridomyces roridus]|uniref:Uncharacterized protein n=1 Tax=Roridomyces roridus TaxID=1738132 RepID=A0AAD7C6R3_9AGAR|nr:hypothetical protein FB45DRAFT_899281 [Roridomyces roridus]
MARFSSLFFGLLVTVLVNAAPAPELTAASAASLSPSNLLGEIIDALGVGLVTQINTTITLDSLTTNLVSVDVELQNPLPFELTLDTVASTAGINGTVFASFNHTFSTGIVVPPFGKAKTGVIDNVLLTQGAIASLAIIPLGFLDLLEIDTNIRALTIDGFLGIPLTISDLHQTNVSTLYTLDLS